MQAVRACPFTDLDIGRHLQPWYLDAEGAICMRNINAVVNEQIRRLARREIKSNAKSVKKTTRARLRKITN